MNEVRLSTKKTMMFIFMLKTYEYNNVADIDKRERGETVTKKTQPFN